MKNQIPPTEIVKKLEAFTKLMDSIQESERYEVRRGKIIELKQSKINKK